MVLEGFQQLEMQQKSGRAVSSYTAYVNLLPAEQMKSKIIKQVFDLQITSTAHSHSTKHLHMTCSARCMLSADNN